MGIRKMAEMEKISSGGQKITQILISCLLGPSILIGLADHSYADYSPGLLIVQKQPSGSSRNLSAYDQRQILIVYVPQATEDEIKNFEEKYRIRLIHQVTLFDTFVYQLPEDLDLESTIETFSKEPIVKIAETNKIYKLL